MNPEQERKLNDIHKALYGNGDKSGGLITMINIQGEKFKNIGATLKIHWGLFIIIIGVIIRIALK